MGIIDWLLDRLTGGSYRKALEKRSFVLPQCPQCGEQVASGHRWGLLAACDLAAQNCARLEEIVAARHWDEARLINEWHPRGDFREYWLLECDAKRAVLLIRWYSPFEPYAPYGAESIEVLAGADADRARRVLDTQDEPTTGGSCVTESAAHPPRG